MRERLGRVWQLVRDWAWVVVVVALLAMAGWFFLAPEGAMRGIHESPTLKLR